MPSAPRVLLHLLLVPGAVAGDHQHRAALGRDQRQRVQQPDQVLVRALGGQAERHLALAEAVTLAQLRLGQCPLGVRLVQAQRHHVDLALGLVHQPHQVVARGARVRDHAMRAPDAERHDHADGPRAQALVRLGEGLVDQVVHGQEAAEAPPRGRQVRRAVQQVHARPHGGRRHQQLVGQHPRQAVAGVHGHGHAGHVAPRPGLAGGVAIDERGEPDVRANPHQRLDQVTRVDLHAAGLAWHEKDEVEADVWALLGHPERHRRHGAGQWRSSPGRC